MWTPLETLSVSLNFYRSSKHCTMYKPIYFYIRPSERSLSPLLRFVDNLLQVVGDWVEGRSAYSYRQAVCGRDVRLLIYTSLRLRS